MNKVLLKEELLKKSFIDKGNNYIQITMSLDEFNNLFEKRNHYSKITNNQKKHTKP